MSESHPPMAGENNHCSDCLYLKRHIKRQKLSNVDFLMERRSDRPKSRIQDNCQSIAESPQMIHSGGEMWVIPAGLALLGEVSVEAWLNVPV